jgi:hypothetical protein
VSEKDKDQPKGKGGEGKGGDKAQAHGADKRDPAGAEKAAARAAAKEKKGGGDAGDSAEKPKKAAKPSGPKVPARVKEKYVKEVVPSLMKERNYPNVMAVPRLRKIVVNMGVGEATQNIKLLDAAIDELGRITGPAPGHAPQPQVDRGLPPPPGHAHRGHGDPARRSHVRVRGPAVQRGPAPRARLPGRAHRIRSTGAATTPWG